MLVNDSSLFGRIVTATATPFDQDGKVDYSALERLVNHLIDNNAQGKKV